MPGSRLPPTPACSGVGGAAGIDGGHRGQQQECSETRADPTVSFQTIRTGSQASCTSTRAGRQPAGERAENPLQAFKGSTGQTESQGGPATPKEKGNFSHL